MNYMKQVAELLGVELGEAFRLRTVDRTDLNADTYKLQEGGLKHFVKNMVYIDEATLTRLLTGKAEIVRIPYFEDGVYHCADCNATVFVGDKYCRMCGEKIMWGRENNEANNP